MVGTGIDRWAISEIWMRWCATSYQLQLSLGLLKFCMEFAQKFGCFPITQRCFKQNCHSAWSAFKMTRKIYNKHEYRLAVLQQPTGMLSSEIKYEDDSATIYFFRSLGFSKNRTAPNPIIWFVCHCLPII